MQIEQIIPNGPWLVKPSLLEDSRGIFFRYYCEETFKQVIPEFTRFLQCNQSINLKKGTLRGMHYQIAPYAENKLVRCIKGKVWDVCIDLRKNSTTFLKWFSIELSEENKWAYYIPKGFAHGFITLSDCAELIYHRSEMFVPESEKGIRFDDPLIGISWPMDPVVISDKDKGYVSLDKNFSGFHI